MNYTNDDRLKPLCSLRQRTRREKARFDGGCLWAFSSPKCCCGSICASFPDRKLNFTQTTVKDAVKELKARSLCVDKDTCS